MGEGVTLALKSKKTRGRAIAFEVQKFFGGINYEN